VERIFGQLPHCLVCTLSIGRQAGPIRVTVGHASTVVEVEAAATLRKRHHSRVGEKQLACCALPLVANPTA